MRSFLIIALAVVAVLLVPVSQFVKAQMNPPRGSKVEICHVNDQTAGTGKLISIAENAAALNAHMMLHGDCEDYELDGDICECEPLTEPMGDDEGDDEGDDDTGDEDDDT